jgi:hypothetical protein
MSKPLPTKTDLTTPKPPCLYPLPDGRRCCECAACHPTEEEQRAWVERGENERTDR